MITFHGYSAWRHLRLDFCAFLRSVACGRGNGQMVILVCSRWSRLLLRVTCHDSGLMPGTFIIGSTPRHGHLPTLITTSALHNAYQSNFQPGCGWNCVNASLDKTTLLYLASAAPTCTGELKKFIMSPSMFIYDGAEDGQLYICIPHEVHLCVCVKPPFSF